MMKPTRKQCVELARATKRICDPEGQRAGIAVWPDYTFTECVDSSEHIARSDGERIEPRIAYLSWPMSADTVREVLTAKLAAA